MPPGCRFHRLKGFCVAVNYTGGVGLTTTKLSGGGNNALTVTPTIQNANAAAGGGGLGGQVTAVAIVAGGAGYAVNDTFTIIDATGTGFIGTVTAVAGGAVTAAAVTVGGTASPINPVSFFATFLLKVKNAPFRNLSILDYLRVCNVRGIYPVLGELPMNFTESKRNFLQINDATSWDLIGGEKFEIQFKINPNLLSPGFTMQYESDFIRNGIPSGNGGVTLFRNPIKYRSTTVNLNAGDNLFNSTTLNTSGEPILRMWLAGSNPGNISVLQVKADSDIKLDGPMIENLNFYEEYGYEFGLGAFLNTNYSTSNKLIGQYNPVSYFDGAYIADVDGRLNEALSYSSELAIKITSLVQQTCDIVLETCPGDYV